MPRNTRGSKQEQFRDAAAAEGVQGDVHRLDNPSPLADPRQYEAAGLTMLRKRIAWMKSRPEYNTRMQNIWAALKIKKISPTQAEGMLWEPVHKSDEQLKRPWWKQDERLVFSG